MKKARKKKRKHTSSARRKNITKAKLISTMKKAWRGSSIHETIPQFAVKVFNNL